MLDATPAPRGGELPAAVALRDWCARRWPDVGWTVDTYGVRGASLVASHGPGPLLYSHLDTSLDGSPRDAAVTGRWDPVGPLRSAGDRADGFGLRVARAPAAAALVAFAGASRGTLLLAGSGTHRRGSGTTGIDAFLARNPLPHSAIVAKCGPPTLLWHEPGALYLTVAVSGRPGVALAPGSGVPPGGVLAHAGVVLAAMSDWREDYLAADASEGQIGLACGIGAMTAGWLDKPDLLPASFEVAMYVVTGDSAVPAALAEDLAQRVRARCANSPLRGCTVTVDLDVVHAAASTAPDAPIVSVARAAWAQEFGTVPAAIAGWTGSTDGVVLRGRGVDTVRLGPQTTTAADDPRRDVVFVDQLGAYCRIYRRLLSAPGH